MSPPEHSLGRFTILLLSFVVGLQLVQGAHPLAMALVITLGAVAGVAVTLGGTSGRSSASRFADASALARGIVIFGFVSVLAQGLDASDANPTAYVCVLVAGVGLTSAFALRPDTQFGSIAFWILVIGYASLMLILFSDRGPAVQIDVRNYLEDAARDLVNGMSPYGGSVANPHSAEETRRFFHADLVEGDRILIGFPYLPGILLVDVLGYLLGDVRYSHLMCLVGSAVLLRRLARDEAGEVLALIPLASPLSVQVLLSYWVEPFAIFMLLLVALALHVKKRKTGVVAVAVLLLSKQYFAAALPFLLVVRRQLGFRTVVASVGLAGAVVLGFLAWSPAGFWNDVVVAQFEQPFRRDSISLVTALWRGETTPPGWVTGVLPLVAGLVVSGLLAVRLRADACAAMLSIGLGLLTTVLLSKQAFPNYYFLVQVALTAAVVTWPQSDLRTTEAASAPATPRPTGAKGPGTELLPGD